MTKKLMKQLVLASLLGSGLAVGPALALAPDGTEGKGGSSTPSTQGTGSPQTTADPIATSSGTGGSGRDKVTVCHKGKKTLSIGAPALDAHLGHGDTEGACGSETGGTGGSGHGGSDDPKSGGGKHKGKH